MGCRKLLRRRIHKMLNRSKIRMLLLRILNDHPTRSCNPLILRKRELIRRFRIQKLLMRLNRRKRLLIVLNSFTCLSIKNRRQSKLTRMQRLRPIRKLLLKLLVIRRIMDRSTVNTQPLQIHLKVKALPAQALVVTAKRQLKKG